MRQDTRHSASGVPGILVLDEEIPWPANTGKRLRTLNLLSELAHQFRVDLLVHRNNACPAAIAELQQRGIEVHLSPSRVPSKAGPLFPFRVAGSLAARLPYSVYSHYQPAFRAKLEELIRTRDYRLIHCEWTPYALYARGLNLPVCIAAHNVEWIIWDRMASADTRGHLRAFYRAQARLMRRFERTVFQQFRHVTAVSVQDAEELRALGSPDVVVVPNGVDTNCYAPAHGATVEPHTLVFTGSMDWRPNQDAIRWFIRQVHPLLKQRTDYRMFVVGRNPPSWMSDKRLIPPELTITGSVDDTRPWIGRGAVYVVPLRVGGGSRLKILEALAMARPVVSTTIGMEGLDLEAGAHLLVADGAETFVDAICTLFANPRHGQQLGNAGRARVEAVYRWTQIAPTQAALWRRAMAHRH
jgi:glycosyltransferase involved in cell wall biosynthesis